MSIKTYMVDGTWMAAQNDQWVRGIYDSEATAVRACDLTDEELANLDKVWSHKGESRAATMNDLAAVSSSAPPEPR